MCHDALKIVYLTENAPKISYKNEKERIDYYYERHHQKINIARSGKIYHESFIKKSDFGIFLGNKYTRRFYNNLISEEKLYLLNPTGLINKRYTIKTNKNFDYIKRNFLWFGSGGAVHKGLDILLDVFKRNKELNLYIAGLGNNEKWLVEKYKDSKNIIDLGFINVQSNEFNKIMDKVAFVILPSASEGMATSVLTCMKHGIIPVVTPYTGIDVENIGIVLNDYKVEYIEKKY